jgi:ABC-type dipeptide/oligopeptide/nickel transport system ATPase component
VTQTVPAGAHSADGAAGGVPVLELTGVVKEYPGDPPVAALAGVDLRIRHGELVPIVGPSASGKSTLLHVTSDALRAPLTLIVGGSVRRQQEGRLQAVGSANPLRRQGRRHLATAVSGTRATKGSSAEGAMGCGTAATTKQRTLGGVRAITG